MRKTIQATAFGAALIAGASGAAAQKAHVSVEGGLACATGKTIMEIDGTKIGDNGCGGRGTIEVGRTGAPVFGILDHWALRGRLSQTKDKGSIIGSELTFVERRTVLDAEVGAKTPFGMFGGVSRLTLGLRYAAWTGELNEVTTAGDTGKGTVDTTGFGPRIGLRSSIPLGTHFMFESAMGVSALFSSVKGRAEAHGTLVDQLSSNGTVYSLDSVSMLSYKLTGTETGSVISVGIASDYYFNQVPGTSGEKVNRYSFGPVARFRMPLQ